MSATEEYMSTQRTLVKDTMLCQDIEVLRATAQQLIKINAEQVMLNIKLEQQSASLTVLNENYKILLKKQSTLIDNYKKLDINQTT